MVNSNTILALTGLLAATSAAPAVVKRTSAPFGVKKGVAYNINDAATASHLAIDGHGATWSYNWSPTRENLNFQQLPMKFDLSTDANAIHSALQAVGQQDRYVLGYNEPDEVRNNGGTAISPGDAYDNWGPQMFQFADQDQAKIICPAITSYNTQSGHAGFAAGLTWLQQFITHNPNNQDPAQFRCFAQAIHWYGCGGSPTDQANAFKSYVADASNQINGFFKTNMPLWITEFSPGDGSCNPNGVSDADRAEFLNQVGPWMNQQSYIDRYSFFIDTYLVSNGQLTQAGNAYVYNM